MTRKILGAALAATLAATPALADYPEKDIQGIIQWGAGGSTDTVMRSVTPHAEAALGGTIVMQNMTGGVGAIALNHVAGQPADGYTLLMGAENPLLYKVMGLGDKDYGDFIPVSLLARGTPILVQIFIIYYGLPQFEVIRDSIFWPILRDPFRGWANGKWTRFLA